MRIPTAQRIYRNSNQCFYYDYSKFASAKVEFLKRKQDRSGYLHVDSFRKEILPTFRIVELRHGRLSTCVAIFVPPNRYTTRPFSQISESNECSTYKRYVLLLGLTAGLISLGSLWLYNLFEWCSGLQTFEYLKKTHQVFNTDESESKRQLSTGNDDNFDFKQRSSNYSKKMESIVDTQVDKKYFDLRCIHYDRKLPSKSEEIFPINCITNTDIVIMNSADHGVRSHFLWTSGSMNCPHYGSGSYKICTICWLNMPDCWLHGPTWSSLNCQLGSNKLWRNTNLLGLLICLQLIYKAIYLACSSVTKQSKCTQTSPISTPNSINNEYSDRLQQLLNTPFKLGSESITASNVNITPISDYPFLEHSKTEFNPSKSDQSNHLLQSKLMSSYDINFMKTSLCNNQENNNVKSLPTSIDNVLFPSMKNEGTDQNSMNNKLSDKDFIVDSITTISTDQLLSKVIEFLNPKQVDWLNSSPVKKSSRSLIHRVHSDAVLDRKISKSCKYLAKEHDYTTRTTTNPPIYHRSRFHSSSSSSASLSCLNIDDNEGFEYDDIISIYTTKDEVMRNINTNQKTIKHPNNLLPSSDSDAIKFTDLTQKTVVLTDELNKLGVTLDRLLYKLQANQIQLDQAEDNLDYMWYLRDNLDDNFPSNTSDCCPEFGLSDVEAEALLNDDGDVDLDGNGSDDNEYRGTDNDYWSSHGRMTQSSTHPNDYYPVRGVSGHLFSSHGTLDSSLYSTLKIPSENCSYHSSNLDSGLEQSVVTCSESYTHMFSPMSEKHLENSLGHHFLYNRYLSNSQVFKNYSHSLSKYSRFKKRCSYSLRKRMCSSESNHFSTNVLPDSDGFLHPDLTFENDGPLKWSESMKVNSFYKDS
ncbi:unnamed protein product [Schistosoma rodhaini]|uniref:HAP1 N-terminal domain-containing protein n=1 Tax=Schistosoma rodhaini TaxID=6188 RepID=A0AA85FUI6_9TREM|nr:unnamed protein product [Schistosoma rodhaini]